MSALPNENCIMEITSKKKSNVVEYRTTAEDSEESLSERFKYNSVERKQRFASGAKSMDIIVLFSAGFALISDGYQNSIMTMLNSVLALEYPEEYTSDMKTTVSYASTVGTIFGQVAVGFTTDYLGRKWSIVVATLFLILGTIMCAASHGETVDGLLWMLIISRGVTGFGIGAEYPSSAVSASEAANESIKRRGAAIILCTNLPLACGSPFGLIIFLIVHQITKNHYAATWRTMFAIGVFWPLSVFYFRMKMATSKLYKDNAIRRNVPYWLALKYYWPRLFGTCACWFLYDFVTFPNGIFSSGIISSVLKGKEAKDLNKVAEWTLLLGVIAIPGVFIGAYLCDRIGRKYTLITGFCGYIIFGLIVGCGYEKVSKITALFIVLYGLMMSSGNLGPGDMMGITPLESFATPIRGTCYGISAAIGKVGAVVGTKCFTPIQKNLGKRWTFIIAAICGLLGVLIAFFFIPHLKDEDLLEEDIKFKNYLIANGWEGDFGISPEQLSTVELDIDEGKESEKPREPQ
ncbi:glycerophosphoinositol transporter 1 [[Candida] railenensis]|uniref:Glycerophosphoinositol transporter 1 n=1 Tax=[Candida] railenensis TaxID=45579 RepID=A0A9P0QPQ3_9ASCO|nr:glycerophosphoinositol transporter 1 [[Candida] railenensis]